MDSENIISAPEFLCPSEGLKLRNTRNSAILDELPDLVGKLIDNGKLRIKKFLGSGAKAACFEAESIESEVFAVKAIPRGGFNTAQRFRVECEIKVHKRLSDGRCSDNVLSLYRTWTDQENDIIFLITELCPKGDLQTGIVEGLFQGNASKIKTTFLQIVDAVYAMHELGIYHCDLKPQNIFMRSCGEPVVGDFGLSTDSEISGAFGFGTIPYMSAELVQSINPNLRSHSSRRDDIWALGVVLFNMVTGKFSWKIASLDDAQFRDYARSPYALLLRRFDISREANDIFRSCFTLDPSARTSLKSLRERVERIDTFGSGAEKLPMKRENSLNLRLNLTVLPSPDVEIPHYRQREGCVSSPSTTDSNPSLNCFRRALRKIVISKPLEPMRVPRRKRMTFTVFEVSESDTSDISLYERDICDMTSISKLSTDSSSPRTPELDGRTLIHSVALIKHVMSEDITEEAILDGL